MSSLGELLEHFLAKCFVCQKMLFHQNKNFSRERVGFDESSGLIFFFVKGAKMAEMSCSDIFQLKMWLVFFFSF